jgi:outer membrane protein TolC
MVRLIFTGIFILIFQGSLISQTKGLDYFLENGTKHSPLISDYANQLLALNADSALVRANINPQITGTNVTFYAPVIGGFGYDKAVTNGGGFASLVGVNQALVSKKNVAAQLYSVSLQKKTIGNTIAISIQELKKTITSQYLTTYGDWQQLQFSREVNRLLEKEESILKKLTQANTYRQTDYLTFLVTLQQQYLATRQQEMQFRNDYATLNYLSGTLDTSLVILDEPIVKLAELPSPEMSVFFRQYTIDSLKILNDKSLLDFSYRPKASLFADAGYNSTLTYQPYKNFGTSFGVNLSVPIYDGRKRKLQHEKLDILLRTNNGYRNFANTQYQQQIAQLRQQFAETEKLISEISAQIKYAESLVQVNSRLLETGDARIADLIIALNNYMTSKNLLTQQAINRLQILNQINYWNR